MEVRQVSQRRSGRGPARRRDGEPLELRIDALGGLGDGIGRLPDGRVVMVADVAPGDRVRIRLLGRRAGVERGRLMQVLEASPHRRVALCPVAGRCGGCTWQHVELATQRQTKAEVAGRALGADAALLRQVEAAPQWAYRRRVRLHLRRDQGGILRAGFMGRGSDELVAVAACPVLVPRLSACLAPLQRWLQPHVERAEVHGTAGLEGITCAITARPLTGAPPPEVDASMARELGLVGLDLRFGSHHAGWGLAEVTLEETVGAVAVRVDGAGFCQAGAAGNAALRQVVQESVGACGELAGCQEFFAGSGNLSALLVGQVPQVRCVELDSAAVVRARASLLSPQVEPGTRFELVVGDAADSARPARNPELWLLDPGRPGAAELCRRAAALHPKHVIYASCAANTLTRDLAILRQAGYAVQSATWLDTAPHTPHFEMVVRLQLGGALPAQTHMP